MERIVYELRPYLYLVVGLIAMAGSSGSRLMFLSALVLMATAGVVLKRRFRHRGDLRWYAESKEYSDLRDQLAAQNAH